MRSVGGLWEQIVARENLTAAAWLAAKGRRTQPAVRAWLADLDPQLELLRTELVSGQIHCGDCRTFTIYDPKQRLITAPVFRERVLHHAIMRVCGPVLERRLIHHSYACRVGKGTYAALAAARAAAQRSAWFVKLDVRKYFDSIDHACLLARLERVFREQRVLDLFHLVLAAYAPQPGRGLPIGTLISQHLANFYLAPLDTQVLQELRPHGYVRYMDDMALWLEQPEQARMARAAVVAHAREELHLEMKTAFINRSRHGMDFLGHRVFPDHLGLSRVSRRRYQHRLRALTHAVESGSILETTAQARAVALTAFSLHADCQHWRRRVVVHLGGGPWAATAYCVAAPGSTTAGTPLLATATATHRSMATTTSASGSPPAPTRGRSAWMEPACCPVPPPAVVVDETPAPRRRSVAHGCSIAPGQDGRRGMLFQTLPS